MVYILARLLQNAKTKKEQLIAAASDAAEKTRGDALWKLLMLLPSDYSRTAIRDPATRKLMDLISFEHGGPDYDSKYPEGIPTSIIITDNKGATFDSELIMFPAGHAANKDADLKSILETKFLRLAELAVKDAKGALEKLAGLKDKTAKEIEQLYDFDIQLIELPKAPGSASKGKKRARDDEEKAPALPEY